MQHAIQRKTLIRVHVQINPKARVLNMNCCYVTVVDCLNPCPPHHLLLFCSCEPTIWRNFLRIIDIYKN